MNASRTVAGTVLATITLALSGPSLLSEAQGMEATQQQQRVRQYPQCPTEDSGNCVWRNHGPGFSFVSNRGPDGTSTRVYRVSDRLADKLIARHGSWQRPPARWIGDRVDMVHPTPSGQHTYRVTKQTVVSFGPTTYLINRKGQVASS